MHRGPTVWVDFITGFKYPSHLLVGKDIRRIFRFPLSDIFKVNWNICFIACRYQVKDELPDTADTLLVAGSC